jgi:selenocysteine lyase/cysteine desulfurase
MKGAMRPVFAHVAIFESDGYYLFMTKLNVTEFRRLFPHIENGVIHLNHAAMSPLSTPVASAMRECIDRVSMDAVSAGAWGFPRYQECRSALARLMGVHADNVALTKNTAQGISIAASGFKFQPGDEVVIAGCEYPANSYPWLAQQERGVVVKIVAPRSDGTVPIEDYAAVVTKKTKIIAASWVQFLTGYKTDIAALANLAHENDALFVVDVIQGLGAMQLDLTSADVDICATGSQKWLMGPVGIGGLYIKPTVLERLRLVNVGAGSVKNVLAFDPLGFDPRADARRYEEGSPNMIGGIGTAAAIEVLEKAGIENIEVAVRNITRYTIEKLKSIGCSLISPDDDDKRAGIIVFNHPKISSDEIAANLRAGKVAITTRGGNIRFSPHYYISEAEIDAAVRLIK